jgi:hypothetical protein
LPDAFFDTLSKKRFLCPCSRPRYSYA